MKSVNEIQAIFIREIPDSVLADESSLPERCDDERPKYKLRPAESLPNGWTWRDWDDGSGSLLSPEGESVVSYDLSTKEYKINGRWSFMGDDGPRLDKGFLEGLVRNMLKL